MTTLLLVSLAGGLGAVARFVLDTVLRTRSTPRYPVGTTVINLSGSLLLGLLTGLGLGQMLPVSWQLVLGTGFLGGYTTFSTASYETVELLRLGRYGAALLNGLGTLGASVGLAALGLWLGLRIAG